ncbi:MAG: hypothetical protein ABSA63_02940 [Thermoplasmata archaeon]|jgi:hypothetical protein
MSAGASPPTSETRAPAGWVNHALKSWAAKNPGVDLDWVGARFDDLLKTIDHRPSQSELDEILVQAEKEAEARLSRSRARDSGPALFVEVGQTLRHYLAFETEWAYDVAALWVMMAACSAALAVVFYLVFTEKQGKGKTTALGLLSKLTGGLNASDVSPAALVYWLKENPCGAVCIDEFDVPRDAERDSALAAVVRTGYQVDGSYDRWDPRAGKLDSSPTFGAKALGYRGKADEATEDRVFVLPLRASTPGRDGARLVVRNYRPRVEELCSRLKTWGRLAVASVDEQDWEGDTWLEKIEAVVGKENIGANRETQLTDVCLRVSRVVGVDLTDSLREAFGVRREVASANLSVDVEEAREVLASFTVNTLTKDAAFVVVRQREFLDKLNAVRKEKGLRAITDGARIRNDLGVRPTWLTHPKNKCTWNVPMKEWAAFVGVDARTGRAANPPDPPNPTVIDEKVSQVSQVSQPLPASAPEALLAVSTVFQRADGEPQIWSDLRSGLEEKTGFSDGELDRVVGSLLFRGRLECVGEGVFRWRQGGKPGAPR